MIDVIAYDSDSITFYAMYMFYVYRHMHLIDLKASIWNNNKH